MASELIASIGLFKTMMDMARGLKDINDTAIRNGAVIELQEKILSAREAQTVLLERVSDLEKEVAGFEAWERQKNRYQLQKLPPSVFVYTLKPAMAEGEPAHYICAKCYEHRKRSILHGAGKEQGVETFHCQECNSKFYVGSFEPYDGEEGYSSSP